MMFSCYSTARAWSLDIDSTCCTMSREMMFVARTGRSIKQRKYPTADGSPYLIEVRVLSTCVGMSRLCTRSQPKKR
jgi:hypothetical protein